MPSPPVHKTAASTSPVLPVPPKVSPAASLRFRWPWRPYQARALAAVERHLDDRRLHVVAAPGSGKTILGLEIFRRLGRPALALSPTRTVRDQWLDRLTDFLPEGSDPPRWVGTDLERPSFFTSVTYQALHARHRRQEEDDPESEGGAPPSAGEVSELAALCRGAGIGTLILDEAHHLRAEWWKALSRLVDELEDVVLVSLTATPPYDVTGHEWRRYQELCGPIDEEIAIPELVKAGNLCPHQDFLWLVAPGQEEGERLRRHDREVEAACRELAEDRRLAAALRSHPWAAEAAPDPAEVLESPEFAAALLVHARALDLPWPAPLADLLDLAPGDLPALDARWWQVLLKVYLFDFRWARSEEQLAHGKELARRLRREGLLWRRELRLTESRPLRLLLSGTAAKVEGCVAVHRIERKARGEALRQVILTDYIREEAPDGALGAWPVFRAIIASASAGEAQRTGLLTGRVVILPERLLPALETLLDRSPGGAPVSDLPGFARLSVSGGAVTSAVTALLLAGELQVLVGTRSLLGEGWDAPAVNSLVLATSVSSFMTTNQMRGRAIRIDPTDPRKTASIWHLAAADPGSGAGLADLDDLHRRFRTFVGPAHGRPVIESGLERLDLPFLRQGNLLPGRLQLPLNNLEMTRRLDELGMLPELWSRATADEKAKVAPTVRMVRPPSLRKYHFDRTLRFLLLEAGLLFAGGLAESLGRMRAVRPQSGRELLMVLAVAALGGFLLGLPRFLKAFRACLRHLPVDGSLRQIAVALRDALLRAGLIAGGAEGMKVDMRREEDGRFTVTLEGGEFYERALFADCLEEVLGPIGNPRYLLTRRGKGWSRRRVDYHAVPALLAARKERANLFLDCWNRRVGPAELIYTRTADGRRRLLKARGRAFSTAMADPVERLDRWQ